MKSPKPLTTAQLDVLDHLKRYGPSGRYAFRRDTVDALLRRGLVELHPFNTGIIRLVVSDVLIVTESVRGRSRVWYLIREGRRSFVFRHSQMLDEVVLWPGIVKFRVSRKLKEWRNRNDIVNHS